jgi:hypothetical protein
MVAERDITIASVYPWGRSFDEYVRMFALSQRDLGLRIVSCADGPAAFNCEMNRRGRTVISCDPLYQFGTQEIRARIEQTSVLLVDLARKNPHLFVWEQIQSPEELLRLRMEAMQQFLNDFPCGLTDGRYVDQSLPRLKFENDRFDLAICSHFLFLYSDKLSLDFHLASIAEMCRIASEVRIFPLVDMKAERSAHLALVLARLCEIGFDAAIEKVEYEFQRGGNQMLRIRRKGA